MDSKLVWCALLVVGICVTLPFAIYDRWTRKLYLHCKKGEFCHLNNVFPIFHPRVPIVLLNYYHKKHLNQETLNKVNKVSEENGCPYKVIQRHPKFVFYPYTPTPEYMDPTV